MSARILIALAAAAASAGISAPAAAQAAAETAIITTGTGAPQARAARGLGSAISGAMRRSGSAIRVQPRGVPRRQSPQAQSQLQTQALPEGDALEGTDAPAYTLRNGATIRVSGRLNPAAGAVCTRNCRKDEMPAAEATEEVKTEEAESTPED